MARIFRKIRLESAREKALGKYLLYASGEVFLIVVGILIALGINNWNIRRLNRNKEQFYLAALQTEFEVSHRKLTTLMEVNRANYEGSQKIAALVASDSLADETLFSELLFGSFSKDISFNPNNSVLTEMIHSGGLSYISHPELRAYLTAWESRVDQVKKQEHTLANYQEQTLNAFMQGGGSVKTILDETGISEQEMGLPKSRASISNLPVLKAQDFENKLLLFILTGMMTESTHYQPLLEEIETILALIKSQIED